MRSRATLALLLVRFAWADDDFWERTADPLRAEFDLAMAEGRQLVAHLGKFGGEEAAAAFEHAIAASPHRPEAHLALGEVLFGMAGREKDAITSFRRARDLGADDEGGRIAFFLGVLLSRVGDLNGALKEYERAARKDPSAVTLANAAETLMALERLSEAIALYRRAVRVGPGYVLGWWGLAVALDRDEQVAAAGEAAQRALSLDPGMAALDEDGVFFVPEDDVFYYRALGDEAAGRVRPAALTFRRFIEALPESPWVGRANRHVEDLTKLIGSEDDEGSAGRRSAKSQKPKRRSR